MHITNIDYRHFRYLIVSLFLVILLVTFGFFSWQFYNPGKNTQIEVIQGSGRLNFKGLVNDLNKDEILTLENNSIIELDSQSVALIVFNNGQSTTLRGEGDFKFTEAKRPGQDYIANFKDINRNLNYSFSNQNGFKLDPKLQLALAGNQGEVLGVNEDLSQQKENKENYESFKECLAEYQGQNNFQEGLNFCLNRFGYINNEEVKTDEN